MAGRRLTLSDLLNDDPEPVQPQRPTSSQQHVGSPDCFPLSLQASSARRTPSPPRGRYDPLSDARMSTSAGSSGGHSQHSPSVPSTRYLTGPGYSPSMSLPRQQPIPQHSPSPLGGLEALMEAASAEQRRMNDESARRSSATAGQQRKRKRPSDPMPGSLPPPPPRVLAGPGMQATTSADMQLAEKEREVIALMAAARAASRSPEHSRSPIVPTVARTSGPRRPWEDSPSTSSSPITWRPSEPVAQAVQPSIRTVEPLVHAPAATVPLPMREEQSEPVILRRVQLTMDVPMDIDNPIKRSSSPPLSTSPSNKYTFKSPTIPPASKPSSSASKPRSTASKPPSVTSVASKPPSVTKPSPVIPEISPTTFKSPPAPKPPSIPKASPPPSHSPAVAPNPPTATLKAPSPPRSPSPPPSPPIARSPELPSFAGPSWGSRPNLAKLAPTKSRPNKTTKRDRTHAAAPAPSASPVSATTALPAASPVLKSPVLPVSVSTPAPIERDESVDRMLEESAGLAPSKSVSTVPASREKEKDGSKKGKAKEKEKVREKAMEVKTEKPAPAPAPAHAPPPVFAPAPVQQVREPTPELAPEPAPTPSVPEPTPVALTPPTPAPEPVQVHPAPAPPIPASPPPASPALDADEELARSLDAQLNRRARPERERRRTEKLRDAAQQPDLEVLLAQAERERAAAPSKNRARDRKKAEDAAKKRHDEESVKGKDAKEDGEKDRGREKRRRVSEEEDEFEAELLSLVGDSRSPARVHARESVAATASPPPIATKAELERESMPPPPSPDEERAGSTSAAKKKGKQPAPKKSGTSSAAVTAGPAKKKPAPKKSAPSARSRSSSVMPMPSSSLAHEVKFDTDDETEPERGASMEVDRAPEPEDPIERAWAQREERERTKREEKEREKASREARRKDKDKDKEREKVAENDKEKSDTEEEDDKLYCVCKMPYDEEKVMIACDRCDEWYHTSCVDMPDSEVDLVDQFICPPCVEKDPHLNLRTTYKRRCQRGLDDDGACHRPSRGALSKYCSDACGIASVRARIGAWNGDKAALWESVRGAERREGVVVRVLDGTPLPNVNADGDARPPVMSVNGDGVVLQPSKPRASRTLARLRSQLDGVVAQRGALTRALEGASWRHRLLGLASARADADDTTCGWDQRLCFGDAEIVEFGEGVFESYEKDAARRAERAESEGVDGEREPEDEDGSEEKADKMDIDGEEDENEAQWWCNGRKKCDRHAGWQKLRLAEVEFDTEMKNLALARLTDREREIRGRVEDILDPHAPVAAAQVDDEVGTPEPMVNGNGHGGAARVNGVEAVAKKSKKKA